MDFLEYNNEIKLLVLNLNFRRNPYSGMRMLLNQPEGNTHTHLKFFVRTLADLMHSPWLPKSTKATKHLTPTLQRPIQVVRTP